MDEATRQWQRITSLLQIHDPAALEGVRPGASPAHIASAEAATEMAWPADVKALLRISNGGLKLPCGRRLAHLEEMISAWRMWADSNEEPDEGELTGYTDDPDAPPQRTRPVHSHAMLLPVAMVDHSSELMADLSPGPGGRAGQIVEVSHGETMSWLCWSLPDYLRLTADALETGRVTKNAGGEWIETSTGYHWWRARDSSAEGAQYD